MEVRDTGENLASKVMAVRLSSNSCFDFFEGGAFFTPELTDVVLSAEKQRKAFCYRDIYHLSLTWQ